MSAGGQLAAVTAILARDNGIPLSFQLLQVPLIDVIRPFSRDAKYREDCPYESYKDLYDTQPLSIDRMEFFARHFLGVPRPEEYENVGTSSACTK